MICYYENKPISEDSVSNAMPILSEVLGIPRITNCRVRPTTVRKLQRAGFEERMIMEFTGHQKVKTLRHYDPSPEISTKVKRVQSIFGPKKSN